MPQFQYEGRTLENKIVKGKIQAIDQSDCYAKLKAQNIYAYNLKEKNNSKGTNYRLKAKELSEFSRQVSTMHNSGIPIVRSLDILKERVTKPKLLEVYDTLSRYIINGNTMSEAMESCGGAFPDIMVNMFRAGEANGQLGDAAAKMAKYYDGEHKVRGKIKSAMIYPTILAVITMIIIVVLFTFVLPKIFEIIISGGGELTGLTLVMVSISDFLLHYWYIALVIFVLVIFGIRMLMQKLAVKVDRCKLRLPIFGRLLSIIYTASFARTLSSLYGGGMSMIEAVELSSKTIGNRYIEQQFVEIVRKIQNGSSLSNAIESLDGLEKKLISAIYVGEETGRLEFVMTQLSQEYEYESTIAIEQMLTFVEPVMLVIMGVIIALVLVSVMGPMTQMYSTIG